MGKNITSGHRGVRAEHQSKDRESTWADRAELTTCYRRRRDRIALSHCGNLRSRSAGLGHEPPRRSLAAVTGLHPISAAPNRAWGGG